MASAYAPGRNIRGPTVLVRHWEGEMAVPTSYDSQVTDAREQRSSRSGQDPRPTMNRHGTSRFITVDNVLQYASDVPSMQHRFPAERPVAAPRTKSGRPAAPKLAGRAVPPHVPARSTKVSEKLVLLPETSPQSEAEMEEKADFDEDNDAAPERDDEAAVRSPRGAGLTGGKHKRGKSYAERLPKSRRAEKLARVTAYCTAQAYKLKAAAAFLRDTHGARTKLYDDCIYAVFQLPLLPGMNGYRVRSSPVPQTPASSKGAGSARVEDEQRGDYGDSEGEGLFEDERERDRFSIREGDLETNAASHEQSNTSSSETVPNRSPGRRPDDTTSSSPFPVRHDSSSDTSAALSIAELYIFSYGVAVFWNLSANQEKDVLADLTFSSSTVAASLPTSHSKSSVPLSPARMPEPIAVSPHPESDFETEEFHFEYDANIPRPRVFNDMITLRAGGPADVNSMVKLTISYAIAQSTKLCAFEQQMAHRMAEAAHVPRALALTGTLGKGLSSRKAVLKLLGSMYRSRVDVNLSSSVLDTPDFFWRSEPTLHPLYTAVREYLEIGPRVTSLNARCRVFLDLAEILSDGIADTKMSTLTWIIIALIAVSILVTCSEVFLRFGLLSRVGSKPSALPIGPAHAISDAVRLVNEHGCVCPSLVAAGLEEEEKTSGGGAGLDRNASPVARIWKEAGAEL